MFLQNVLIASEQVAILYVLVAVGAICKSAIFKILIYFSIFIGKLRDKDLPK